MWDNFVSFILEAQNIVFLVLALVVMSGAMYMINFTKVVHMVSSLAVTFIGLAGLYILLEAEFIAMVQVLIYGGAITILMLFGIMMTKHDDQQEQSPKRPLHNYFLLAGVVVFFFILFYSIQKAVFPVAEFDPGEDNTLSIGQLIFTEYVIPFELLSVLLTVAFIGAIVLAKREEE